MAMKVRNGRFVGAEDLGDRRTNTAIVSAAENAQALQAMNEARSASEALSLAITTARNTSGGARVAQYEQAKRNLDLAVQTISKARRNESR
jgi:hypothetical protein